MFASLSTSICRVGWWLSIIFFFFKQKTAYELRISDWSSDVCSSDLFRIFIKQDAWQRIARHAENASKNVCFSQNHPQKRPRVCGAGGECCAMKQKRRGDRGYTNHTPPSPHPATTPAALPRYPLHPPSFGTTDQPHPALTSPTPPPSALLP